MQKTLNVSNYEVFEANVEALRLALNAQGEPYSAAWFHGVAGSAFRIGGICPCAPTCTFAMSPQQVIKLLGYEYTEFPYDDADKDGALEKAVTAVRASIDNGVPAMVWHAFSMCEWDVVAGYDAGEQMFFGRSSGPGNAGDYAKKPWNTTLSTFASNGVMAIAIQKGPGGCDKRSAEIAAIREAIRHANDTENTDKLGGSEWVFLQGKAAYNRWADDFSKPEYKRGLGDAYCIGIYASSHGMAAPFLREIAPNYPGASERLLQAAECFDKETEALHNLLPLLGWNSPEVDPLRNERAAPLLREAAGHYGSAIDLLSTAVENI